MDALKKAAREGIRYPESDGKPMADLPAAGRAMIDSHHVLLDYFRGRVVHVALNNFVYRVEGNIKQRVSPDVYVVKGLGPEERGSYGIWEAGPPCFVLEVLAEKTYRFDMGKKKGIYRRMGVREYALFDPFGKWIAGQLEMHRLGVDGRFRRVRRNARGRFMSRELELELGTLAETVRFYLPGAASPLPTREERAAGEAARAEQERARAEQQRQEKERAEARAERQCQEKERAEARAVQAEAQARRLTEELEQLRRLLDGRKPEAPR